ncbi:MAG: hypothetical protein IJR06_02725, partial [Paludibacteraceae bacterium]|nr:hypothetical protein [Paludibacteraceae bacterium]
MTLDPSISAIYTACGGNASPENKDYERSLEICRIAQDEIGVGKTTLTAIMLYPLLHSDVTDIETINRIAGKDTAMLLSGIHKVQEIYDKAWQIDTDNFKHLLLSLA